MQIKQCLPPSVSRTYTKYWKRKYYRVLDRPTGLKHAISVSSPFSLSMTTVLLTFQAFGVQPVAHVTAKNVYDLANNRWEHGKNLIHHSIIA